MSPNLAPKLSKLFSATIFKERKNPLKLAVLEGFYLLMTE
jgi:hypothetical protein